MDKEKYAKEQHGKEQLYGREITEGEWQGSREVLAAAEKRPGMQKNDGCWICGRCGMSEKRFLISAPCACGGECFYCAACLQMGKVKKCQSLYSLPETNRFPAAPGKLLCWEGTLSPEQTRAAWEVAETVRKKEKRLVWAVAGSGKTEMIFPGIAAALSAGERVCLASPRIDVCLELAPRLQAAFPHTKQQLLYGGSEAYCYTQLVIATTHQLLRFREAFDLLIIDEVDSFPFHNDRVLQYGAEKARKKESALLYLTATPPRYLQQEAAAGILPATILPARYHRHPLPEADCVWVGDWRRDIKKRNKRAGFLRLLRKELAKERRFLLFLPQIELMENLETWLQSLFPGKTFTSVSAEDPQRVEKVKQMRKEQYDFLLTTTILERGVTFRDIDVLVLGAEDPVFTEASLVQIAGRAGRHKDYPGGTVQFAHFGHTKAMKGAVKQIKAMNKRAAERGLLDG